MIARPRSAQALPLLLLGGPLLGGCLYTEDIPTPPIVAEALPPVFVNTNPPPFSRLVLTGDGQLFEVWVEDPNLQDRDGVTVDWQLERVGLRGQGTKLFLRPEDLPEGADDRYTLEARAQDGNSGATTLVSWELRLDPGLEDL